MTTVPTLTNAVQDDILCFITTARESLSKERVVQNAAAFYSKEAIKKSKDALFELRKEVPPRRNASKTQPNPAIANLEDIFQLLEKIEEAGDSLPKFVAINFMSFPPSVGFETLAPIMCSLRDEVMALRTEVSEVRKVTEKDLKALDNVGCILQDVAEIKRLVLHNTSQANDVQTSSNLRVSTRGDAAISGGTPQNPSASQRHENRSPSNEQMESNESLGTAPYAQVLQEAPNGPTTGSSAPLPQLRGGQRVNDSIEASGGRGRGGRGNSFRGGYRQRGGRFNGGRSQRGGHFGGGQGQRSGNPGASQNRVGDNNSQMDRVTGTRTAAEGGLTAATRTLDFVVAGCEIGTTAEDIITHCSSNGVIPRSCVPFATRSQWCCCFKLTVTAADGNNILVNDLWPEGVRVRKFFRR